MTKLRETTYTITNGQTVAGQRLETGDVLAKLYCRPEMQAHKVIEAMRGGVPDVSISEKVVEVADDRDSSGGGSGGEDSQPSESGKGRKISQKA